VRTVRDSPVVQPERLDRRIQSLVRFYGILAVVVKGGLHCRDVA
jgi:hypothetical protein